MKKGCLIVLVGFIFCSVFEYSLTFAEGSEDEKYNLYYAIESYPQFEIYKDQGWSDKLESITFGWSSLQENNADGLEFSTRMGDFVVPQGYELAIQPISDTAIRTYLNVYSSGPYTSLVVNKESIIESIMKTVTGAEYEGLSFDGVVLDFEAASSDSQRDVSVFAWFLNSALEKEGKTLKMALQPGRGTEYFILNEFVEGYILMLHDYDAKRYDMRFDPEKPIITPLAPVERVVADIKSELEAIGAEGLEKITLQLNMASSQWKVRGNTIVGPVSGRPFNPTTDQIIHRMNLLNADGKLEINRSSDGSPYIFYFDETDNTYNTICYEDQISIQAKIDAAKALGVKQFSVWRLGNIGCYDIYDMDIMGTLDLVNNYQPRVWTTPAELIYKR